MPINNPRHGEIWDGPQGLVMVWRVSGRYVVCRREIKGEICEAEIYRDVFRWWFRLVFPGHCQVFRKFTLNYRLAFRPECRVYRGGDRIA